MKTSKMPLCRVDGKVLRLSIIKLFMMFFVFSTHCLGSPLFHQDYVYHDIDRELYEIHDKTPISAKEAYLIAKAYLKTNEIKESLYFISLNGEEYFFMTTPESKFGFKEVGIYVNYNNGNVRFVNNSNKYIRPKKVESTDYQYYKIVKSLFYEWENDKINQ